MNIRTLLFLMTLLYVQTAGAFYHRKAARDFAANHVMTGSVGIGAVEYIGVGAAAEYEHFLDKDGLLSVTGALGFYLSGTLSLGEIDYGEVRTRMTGTYFAPGIRMHPLGNGHRVDLGFGASFPLGRANCRDYEIMMSGESITHYDHKFFGAGVGQLTCNFKSQRGPIFGLFLNCGYIYSNAHADLSRDATSNTFFMFGIRFGGQW